MPPRSLIGILFAAAAALWWLLLGVLLTVAAPEGGGPSAGFWAGTVLMAASGFGWGAMLRPALVRRASASSRAGRFLRPVAAGGAVLLLAGLTALAAGLLLTALFTGVGAMWGTVRQALARPEALVLPVAGVLLVGLPSGAAAGLVLRAMIAPSDDERSPSIGSRPNPRR